MHNMEVGDKCLLKKKAGPYLGGGFAEQLEDLLVDLLLLALLGRVHRQQALRQRGKGVSKRAGNDGDQR